ncbi:MAG: hypothetical protein LBG46_02795 [Elusimicrobiota bacterium]|nr:hypothetical protein [Elusimicrobiota bacterium]
MKLLKPNWKYIAKDIDEKIFAYEERPVINETKCWQATGGISTFLYHLFDIEFPSDNWRESLVERPVDYGALVGKWGVFADNERYLNLSNGEIGRLAAYDTAYPYPYEGVCRRYKFFRLFTDEEKKEIIK